MHWARRVTTAKPNQPSQALNLRMRWRFLCEAAVVSEAKETIRMARRCKLQQAFKERRGKTKDRQSVTIVAWSCGSERFKRVLLQDVSVLRTDSHGFCHITSLGRVLFGLGVQNFETSKLGYIDGMKKWNHWINAIQCQEKNGPETPAGPFVRLPNWSYHRVPLNCSTFWIWKCFFPHVTVQLYKGHRPCDIKTCLARTFSNKKQLLLYGPAFLLIEIQWYSCCADALWDCKWSWLVYDGSIDDTVSCQNDFQGWTSINLRLVEMAGILQKVVDTRQKALHYRVRVFLVAWRY